MERKIFAEILKTNKAFFLDGSTGTNLMKAGIPSDICPEMWIIENSDIITKLQNNYMKSGSNAVCAPTFGANRESLKRYGLDGKVCEINEKLVEITRNAVEGNAYVAGDISPSGLFLSPYGDTEFSEIFDIFFEQAKILDEAGVDLFLIETQLSLAETRATLLAVRAASKKPVLVCVSVDEKGLTMSGNSLESCLLTLSTLGADAVGCNCSVGPDKMRENLAKAGNYSYAPLIAKANAGKPHGNGADMHFDVDAEDFVCVCEKMAAEGIQIIGGCCGTTPEYIKLLNERVRGNNITKKETEPNFNLDMCCSNEKEVFFVSPDMSLPEPIECSVDLEDNIMEVLDDGADIIRIILKEENDPAILIENSFLISVPLMLGSENMQILDEALKMYPGRVIIDPSIELTEISRKYFTKKYNPVFLD